MRQLMILLSIVCLPLLVNAAGKRPKGNAIHLSARGLAAFMIRTGDSATEELAHNRAAPLLGFPKDLDSVPFKGDSTDDNELGPDAMSTCKIVVEHKRNGPQPVCILIDYEKTIQTEHRLVSYLYRYSLDGRLENAVESEGQVDDKGNPITASGVLTSLNVADKNVLAGANEQLDLWLNRTARKIAAEKAKEKGKKK